jgi:hypothetical protein
MATVSAAAPAVLESLVYRLPPVSAAAPSMAPTPTQFPTWKPCLRTRGQLHSTPVANWVILDTHPGSDGNICVVIIKTPKGVHNKHKNFSLTTWIVNNVSTFLGVAVCSRKELNFCSLLPLNIGFRIVMHWGSDCLYQFYNCKWNCVILRLQPRPTADATKLGFLASCSRSFLARFLTPTQACSWLGFSWSADPRRLQRVQDTSCATQFMKKMFIRNCAKGQSSIFQSA